MKGKRDKTLPEVLGEYARSDPARFHMPGHKGRGIPMAEPLCAWDVTELPSTDNLHQPSGAILKTQEKYAQTYGARSSFLLVNGSTAGVLAMLLSLGEKKRVLLSRNCHKSAISGAALAGHELCFIDQDGAVVPQAEQIELELSNQPADAVLLTSPDYYGRCADIRSISKTVHNHGAILLVDAAHGAHFPFSAQLPDLCADCVDMFCVSAHKTLNAFTQAAVLFIGKNCPIGASHIQGMLSMVQSSSPSYPLMVSLDWALHSSRGWDEHIERMHIQQKRLSVANGVRVQTEADVGISGVFAVDPTRLVINVHERGISGIEAYRSLYAHGVVPEMADRDSLVFITCPQDPDEWYNRLYKEICTLPYGIRIPTATPVSAPRCERLMPIRGAMLASGENLPLHSAAGRTACRACGLYPPGNAVLLPGERISPEIIDYILDALAQGYTFFGLEEGNNIRVVR